MARKKGKRGSAAGRGKRAGKARGSRIFLDNAFVGHGEVRRSDGTAASARLAALREAWEDAAGQALGDVVTEYRNLGCKAGCHKSWRIDFPRPENPTGKQIFAGIVKQFALLLTGGLAVEVVHISPDDRSGPDVARYTASVILKQSFVLECAGDASDTPKPDPDMLLATTRAIFKLLEEFASRCR